jgi:uncharacterized protein (DUF302 family)
MKFSNVILAALAAVILLIATEKVVSKSEKQGNIETMMYEVELLVGFDEAIEKVTEQLQAEHFGIVSRIDLHAVFKKKLDVDSPSHTILGVCNPKLAYKAVSSTAEAAILLPCKITVQAIDDNLTIVRIVNPTVIMANYDIKDNSVVRELFETANAELKLVVKALAAQ